MSHQDDVPGSLIGGYVLPEEEEEERRVQTDLWSDPHDGFMAMLLLPTSELLQLFFLSTLSVIGSVLGQSNRGSLSLSLALSVISLFYMSWLFLFFLKLKFFPARVYSSSQHTLISCPAQLTCSNTRNLRDENLPNLL